MAKNTLFWIVYGGILFVFVTCCILSFFPTNTKKTTAEMWIIPSEKPKNIRIEDSTYYVKNANEFLWAMNLNSDITIEFVDNINLTGKFLKPFEKTTSLQINGNGFSILGLALDNASSVSTYQNFGLIGRTTSTIDIKNLNVAIDFSIISNNNINVGTFVAYSTGNVTLENCSVQGEMSVFPGNNKQCYVGGFVGHTYNTVVISQCINYANISVYEGASKIALGGIVGHDEYLGGCNILTSANYGDLVSVPPLVVSDYNNINLGGLVGLTQHITISTSFNAGRLQQHGVGCLGGLIGNLNNASTIKNCYNSGDIIGKGNYVGGIVGNTKSVLNLKSCYSGGKLEPSLSYTNTNTQERLIKKYKTFGEQLYTTYDNSFPTSSVYNGGDSGGDTHKETISELIISEIKISRATSLVGGNTSKTTVENCYFYNQNVIPSSPYLEFKIQMKFPGGYTDLGNIVFNQNNTFLMQGGEKMYIEQDKIKEHNLIYGSNILIFKGLVVLDFISDDIRYGSYTNGRRYVSFHYDNEETMFGIDLPPSCGQISTPIENIWLYGLKCEISQQNADTLSFSPVIGYTLSCTNSSYGDTVDYLAIYSTLNQSYSLVNILNANNRYVGMYMSNLEQIKSNIENLGSEYEIDKDINDGLPFLKDFYWQFS